MMLIASALALVLQTAGTPCETITRPANHWGAFTSSFILADLSVRVTEGLTACTFNQAGGGNCSLIKPKTLVVTQGGRETWFAVPDDKGADLQISRRGVTCTVRPLIRMD